MKTLTKTPFRGTGLGIAHAVVGWLLALTLTALAGFVGYPADVFGARAVIVLAVFMPVGALYYRWRSALPRTPAALLFTVTALATDALFALGAGEEPIGARIGGWLAIAAVYFAVWLSGKERGGESEVRV